MEMRKLVQSGLGSFVISVPKRWLDQHKLRKGDIIAIDSHGDNLILLPTRPKERRQAQRVMLDAAESTSVLTRKLIAAYIEGCAEVVINGERDYEKDAVLWQQIDALAGYEILEKTKDRIVVHDLLRLEEVSIQGTFRKMDMTLRMMLDELAQMLKSGQVNARLFVEEDRLLNKLYHTIARIVRAVLKNEIVQKEYDNLYELLLIDHLSKTLEDLGDHLKYLAQEVVMLPKAQQQQVSGIYGKIISTYGELLDAYHKRNREVAYTFADLKHVLHKACGTIFRNARMPETTIVSRRLKSILVTFAEIARMIRYR